MQLTAFIKGIFRAKRLTSTPGVEVSRSNQPTGCLRMFSNTCPLALTISFSLDSVMPLHCKFEKFSGRNYTIIIKNSSY